MRILLLVLIFISRVALSQDLPDVYPLHWWIGMKDPSLQLMLHASHDLPNEVSINYPGVTVKKIHQPANKHYLFIDLDIASSASPGAMSIRLPGTTPISYSLKRKSSSDGVKRVKGISSKDLIYLIMPDRFSNGDPTNDRVPGLKDQSLNRDSIFLRHGGDLRGIENHLDYLQDLGVTALWLNPVLENDMPERTEHGYAFTNHYHIEKRLGGETAYQSLITALHNRGMKIIQDAVYNHVGIEHFLFRDLPDSSFFHFWPVYTNTTYKDQVLLDPYGSSIDKKRMTDGWFVPSMPDLNQKNKYVSKFLIQHAIWCTEEFGIDGWRVDTYAYNDLQFMNKCNKALLDQFPKLHIFGETWVHGIPDQSFFTRNVYTIDFKSNLPGVTDFQLNLYGIVPALTQAFGWTEGVNRLHLTATNDYVYEDPMKNVIFLDNHDLSRFFSVVGEDTRKLKMGLAWLLTYRGIPQLYYGTEIGMKNFANPDGLVRLDFPGGWPGDPSNKFDASGRNDQENDIFNFTRTLARFRKNSSALQTGKMMQYVPEDAVYVYFRYNSTQTVMCIMNTTDREVQPDMNRFSERVKKFTRAKNVVDGNEINLNDVKVPAWTLAVLELKLDNKKIFKRSRS